MNNLTPREIVNELDKYIIGQEQAKKMVLGKLKLHGVWQSSPVLLLSRWKPQNILKLVMWDVMLNP